MQSPPALPLDCNNPTSGPFHPQIVKTLFALHQFMILQTALITQSLDFLHALADRHRISRKHAEVVNITAHTRTRQRWRWSVVI